jgi:tetratricopeptide (TPR) repeat protein
MKIDSSELKNQIQLGKNLLKAKEYQKAEKIFLNILKQHQLADVHNALGLSYADSGNFNAAEFCFQKALQINPNYMEAALNLSVLYNNLGYGKKSKEIYTKLRKYGAAGRGAMDPMLLSKIANLYAEVGDLFHSVGEYKYAIGAYSSAIDFCPQFLDLHTKLAVAHRESGNKKKALQILEKQKSKAGKFATFWVALGVTYYALNRSADAMKAWERAVKIEPNNASAKTYLKLKLKPKAAHLRLVKKPKK